jgi:hypothetical protein
VVQNHYFPIRRIRLILLLHCADGEVGSCPHTRTPLSPYRLIRMSAQEPLSAQASPPRGTKSKKSKPKSTSDPKGKRSLNLSIGVDTYERLLLHAMRMTNGNISELVERLASEHLREFHLTRTATRTPDTDAA